MIRIIKGQKPAILVQKANEWTQEYKKLLAGEDVAEAARFRYRHPEIKMAIRQECHEKCAYCESKITHIYPGDVDHVHPSSKCPELVVEWQNLLLACGECNRRKSAYFDPLNPLIDPTKDDPQAHLMFIGPMLIARPGSDPGFLTTTLLELHRTELFQRRLERIQRIWPLLDLWARANDTRKQLLRQEILREAEPDQEFSAMIVELLAQINFQ
jgi:hypothetical protein